MVGNNKILTVSYGTFSCTLEGFDDSFDTMKAIAEYFRDLAGDDRYFGAEPPTPDAEMLARIAEREIARRVEARTEAGGIVLRPSTPQIADTSAVAPQSVVPQAVPEQSVAVPPQTQAAPAPQPEPQQAEPQQTAAPKAETETETETKPLANVLAPKAKPLPKPAPKPVVDPVAEASADAAIEDAVDAIPAETQTDLQADPQPAPDTAPETAVADLTADQETVLDSEQDQDTAPQADVQDQQPVQSEVAHPDAASVAAKLRRIRAVMARDSAEDADVIADTDTEAADLANELVDNAAEDIAARDENDDDMRIASLLGNLKSEGAEEAAEAEVEVEVEDIVDAATAEVEEITAAEEAVEQSIQAITEELNTDAPDQDDQVAEEQVQNDVAQDAADAADSAEVEDQADQAVADTLAALNDETSVDPEPEVAAEVATEAETEAEAEAEDKAKDTQPDQAEAPDQTEAPAQTRRARVLRVKRADMAAAAAAEIAKAAEAAESKAETGAAENAPADTAAPEAQTPKATPAPADGSLSQEAEDDLMRELAALEADAAPQAPPAPAATEETAARPAPRSDEPVQVEDTLTFNEPTAAKPHGRALLERAGTDDDATDRLLSEANTQMEAPEHSRRRNAIAHLKAAVAATRADQGILGRKRAAPEAAPQPKEASIADQRSAEAVRPRRPMAASTTRSSRPQQVEPPLRLVAEQRVDTPPAAPIRPRRVASADVALKTPEKDQDDFASFAESKGATRLMDILEAAAAYTAHVDGRDPFTRPQVMMLLKSAMGDAYSREDSLRAFGQLLREGKIAKVQGGRFTVTEDARFQPAARAAGA